jgi:formylglycine-generating enzyme required for sulfatase activity
MTELEALAQEFSFVDFEAMEKAVADLSKTYPDNYKNGAAYLAKIKTYKPLKDSLQAKLNANDATAAEKCREILDFRRDALINQNPAIDFDQILYTKRKDWLHPKEYSPQRGGKSVGLPTNFEGNSLMTSFGWESELNYIDIRKPLSEPDTIYKPEGGLFVGDLNLNFDADKILFSSVDAKGVWQVFEIKPDGTGLRQVSSSKYKEVDNFNGIYLPDGRIMFSSTSGLQAVPCVNGVSPVGNLHIMNADGSGMRRLTFDQESLWYPTVIASGQIMYTRWEYTDSMHFFTRIIMTMNPDGTSQKSHYGSNSFWPNSIFYPKQLPGQPTKFIGVVSGHHNTRRAGELYIFDVAKGRKETTGVVQQIPTNVEKSSLGTIGDGIVDKLWPKFLHPYPLTAKQFLVSCKPGEDSHWGIYYVDVFNNVVLLREETGFALFEPIAKKSTPKPPVIPDRVNLDSKTGTVVIQDIYEGPGLEGVPRGTVKALRLFSYEYGYNKMAGHALIGVEGPWDVKRIMGTVPVNEDGSVMFTAPANRPFSIQPIDAEGNALQIMRSWTMVSPGEVSSCVGCHEDASMAAIPRRSQAMTQAPSPITPWYGPNRGFSFDAEVQPVLDRYCIGCHDGSPANSNKPDFRGMAAKKDKNGFSAAYNSLHPFVRRPGLESDVDLQVPLTWHSNTSELMQMLRKGHHNVKVDEEGLERLRTWIDLNVPALGSWTEIQKSKTPAVSTQMERRAELQKLYGNVEINTNVEHAADYDRTFVKPAAAPEAVPHAGISGWPLTETQAKEMVAGKKAEVLNLGNGVTMKLMPVPAGQFLMGSTAETRWEQPQSATTISKPFLMGETEVTLKQFKQFKADHRNRVYDMKNKDQFSPGFDTEVDDYPVIRINWAEAVEFCKWLSEKTGKKVSLPTEAQWEWACRAGTDTPMSYGALDADFSTFANMSDYTTKLLAEKRYPNYEQASKLGKIKIKDPSLDYHPKIEKYCDGFALLTNVGHYNANAWGLKDMHGSVAEWTRSNLAQYPYSDANNDDSLEKEKVVRGGSWADRPKRCTSSYRLAYPAWQKVYNVGFRVVIED